VKFIWRVDLLGPATFMKAHLVHVDAMRFRVKADEAPEILFDAGDRETRKGPSPVQGALLSAIACTAADIVLILRKERVPFTSLEIEANAERAKEDPKVFTKIRLHYKVRGNGIKDSAVKRAIDLSSEKYCTVGIMLRRGGVEFVNTYEILAME
jgi:putative redox protein